MWVRPPDPRHLVGIRDRKRAKQEDVREAQDRRVSAYGQRHGGYGHDAERRLLPEHSQAIAQVLDDGPHRHSYRAVSG